LLLSGDKGFDALAPLLQAHGFQPVFPKGSKATLLREVRVVCSPWSGCDAYLMLPGSVRMPSQQIKIKAIQVPLSNAPKGSKTIEIKQVPAQP
jgi:hypothetical protein